jgi:hypothetical protein
LDVISAFSFVHCFIFIRVWSFGRFLLPLHEPLLLDLPDLAI